MSIAMIGEGEGDIFRNTLLELEIDWTRKSLLIERNIQEMTFFVGPA